MPATGNSFRKPPANGLVFNLTSIRDGTTARSVEEAESWLKALSKKGDMKIVILFDKIPVGATADDIWLLLDPKGWIEQPLLQAWAHVLRLKCKPRQVLASIETFNFCEGALLKPSTQPEFLFHFPHRVRDFDHSPGSTDRFRSRAQIASLCLHALSMVATGLSSISTATYRPLLFSTA